MPSGKNFRLLRSFTCTVDAVIRLHRRASRRSSFSARVMFLVRLGAKNVLELLFFRMLMVSPLSHV